MRHQLIIRYGVATFSALIPSPFPARFRWVFCLVMNVLSCFLKSCLLQFFAQFFRLFLDNFSILICIMSASQSTAFWASDDFSWHLHNNSNFLHHAAMSHVNMGAANLNFIRLDFFFADRAREKYLEFSRRIKDELAVLPAGNVNLVLRKSLQFQTFSILVHQSLNLLLYFRSSRIDHSIKQKGGIKSAQRFLNQ